MKTSRLITTVDAHIGGEVSRVITGGVIDLPGKTMSEKLHYINNVDDSLRRFVLHEPRGGVDKTTNLVVPPTRDDADVGFFPDGGQWLLSDVGCKCDLRRNCVA